MKRRLWIHTIIALSTLMLTAVLHQRIGRAGIDANTSLRLRLKKPDIIDARFIARGNWYYVMRNQGSFMYDRDDWDHDGNNAGGAFPRVSGTTVVFAAGAWIGAIKNGVPVVSETQFATEFQPGRIINSGVPFEELVADSANDPVNQVYVMDRTTSLQEWQSLPEAFFDRYGESPSLLADVQTWAVFNDLDTTLSQEKGGSSPDPHSGLSPYPGLGLEITLESMVYETPFLNNSVLLHYTIVNKTNTSYSGAYFGLWMDGDVDVAYNDILGSDSTRGLGYIYNGDNNDKPLAVGFDILQGPVVHKDSIPAQYAYKFQNNTNVLRLNRITKQYEARTLDNDSVWLGATTANSYFGAADPNNNWERYIFLRGLDPSGFANPYFFNGWYFPGNPVTGTGSIHMTPNDQRILVATGPFRMLAGGSQEIWAAVVGGEGVDRLDAVANLFQNDDIVQSIFASGLGSTLTAPPAPSLSVTAGDGFVTLTWDSLAEEASDPIAALDMINTDNGYSRDLLLHDFQGYRLWKSLTALPGQFDLIAQFDRDDGIRSVRRWYLSPTGKLSLSNVSVGEDTGIEYTYTDHDVHNGRRYYYALTAYDAQPAVYGPDSAYYPDLARTIPKPLIMNPSTESSLWDNITAVTPQPKKAESKKELSHILVVPNPFYATTSEGEQIKFTGLPASCTIRIFTVAGDLVKTLKHHTTSNNNRVDDALLNEDTSPLAQETSVEVWNLKNEKKHPVAPGIYIAHIHSSLGDKIVKFAVIR